MKTSVHLFGSACVKCRKKYEVISVPTAYFLKVIGGNPACQCFSMQNAANGYYCSSFVPFLSKTIKISLSKH